MELNKPIVLQCDKCGEVIEANLDFDCVFTDERSMGAEFEYEGVLEDICPICKNLINLKIDIWEYPIGTLNYIDENIKGASMIETLDISLIDEEIWDEY